MRLFDAEGRRLYLTEEERRVFVLAAAKAPREVRTFCGVLHATGCRISEPLALTPRNGHAREPPRDPGRRQARQGVRQKQGDLIPSTARERIRDQLDEPRRLERRQANLYHIARGGPCRRPS